ncbi:MAG: hypothetical protein KPEEDBHJ_03087 [Anaerolineales bacterium]|nr:hypothetical protein [Anaerolineales bacterium]
MEKHYFMTLQGVFFPEDRFCAKCGEYFTHPNHLHGRDCQCKTCQQERLLTPRAADIDPLCPECHCELHLTTAGDHVCRNEACGSYR